MLVGVASRLSQCMLNIMGNAIDAVGEQGGGEVVARLIEQPNAILISVSDDGPGISDSILPRVFEPLFTTKPLGKGTGLGLSIVKEIIEHEFGGRIDVDSAAGSGTKFTLQIPKQMES